MQNLIPAILFALAVGVHAAAAQPLRQSPSVRVGPLADEHRAEGESDAAPAKKAERPAAGPATSPAAGPSAKRPEEHGAAEGSRRDPESAKNGTPPPPAPDTAKTAAPPAGRAAAAGPEAGAAPRPDTAPARPNETAKPSDPPGSQLPAAAKNPVAAEPSGLAAGERVSAAQPSPPTPPLTAVYRIGAGDVLDIRVLNMADARQSTLFTVLSGGVLEYPLLRDPLTVAGMTTEELSAQLVAELRHRGIYDRPQVRVSVREYASHAVLVSGLANDPGTKILRREAVPLYVVVAESQPKPEAGRAVIISHKTGLTTTVDLNDPAALNVLVQAGDVVNLVARPPAFFYVGGEIGAPGQKEFHAGMTLTQGLLASGGVTRAAGPKVRVSRQGADGRLVSTEYDLPEIEKGQVPDPALQPGDRIEVSRARTK